MLHAKDIVEYIRQNHDAWYSFATNSQTYGLQCKPEDIIMVRGTVKTSAWAVAAYRDSGNHTHNVAFSGQVGPVADAGFQLTSSSTVQSSFEHRAGPTPNAARPTSLKPVASGTSSNHGKYELPELEVAATLSREEVPDNARNQTVFLGFYKVKRRYFLPKKIVANAGSDELPPAEDPAQSSGMLMPPDVTVEINQPAQRVCVVRLLQLEQSV